MHSFQKGTRQGSELSVIPYTGLSIGGVANTRRQEPEIRAVRIGRRIPTPSLRETTESSLLKSQQNQQATGTDERFSNDARFKIDLRTSLVSVSIQVQPGDRNHIVSEAGQV